MNYKLVFLHSKVPVISSLLFWRSRRPDKTKWSLCWRSCPEEDRGPSRSLQWFCAKTTRGSVRNWNRSTKYRTVSHALIAISIYLQSKTKFSNYIIHGKLLKDETILFFTYQSFTDKISEKNFMHTHFNLLKTKSANNKETIIQLYF